MDQRNLLGINSIYLQVQLLCKRLLVGLLLLTAAGAVFNNLLFGTKLAGTLSAFLQGWWHCLRACLASEAEFNPLVAVGAAPDRNIWKHLAQPAGIWFCSPSPAFDMQLKAASFAQLL